MLFLILVVMFILACLGWLVCIILPTTREDGIYLYFLLAVMLINLAIQVVNICTN